MAAARLLVSVATPDSTESFARGIGPWLAKAAPAAAKGELSLALVSAESIAS